MRGGGQVPAHLHAAPAAAGSGQDAGVCRSAGQVLQAQAVHGAVWRSRLRAQLRAARAVQVRQMLNCSGLEPVYFYMQLKAAVKTTSRLTTEQLCRISPAAEFQ